MPNEDSQVELDLPAIRALGDQAISVDFGNTLSAELAGRVLALEADIVARSMPGVVETVPTYRALTVHIDPLVADLQQIERAILTHVRTSAPVPPTKRRWLVPVLYGGPDGFDLELVAQQAGLSISDCIDAHATPEYLVAMIGFLPGFCYLAGLDPRLATPRRQQPRPRIPASSISVGGRQTAIGSVAGPSGWHVIGRTPVQPYHPDRTPMFLFEPGDRIRFKPVTTDEAERLAREPDGGVVVAESNGI